MKTALVGVAGLAATSLLVGVSAVGCGSKTSAPASSSSSSAASSATTSSAASSSAAAQVDYSNLLIKDSDITPPDGDTFTAAQPAPPPNGQPGVTVIFTNKGGTRTLGDTILVLPDPAAAAGSLDASKGALGTTVTGTPAPADVGTGGTIVSGASPDGSKAITVLMFTEGKAFVTMEFDSPPGDIVPADFVTSLGQKQDAAIKNSPPS